MNILIDAVSASQGGGATFISEQLRALEQIPDLRLTIITTRAASEMATRSEVISWPTRPLPIRILHEQTAIPRLSTGYDCVYLPGNFASALARVPQVLVLQSLWHFGRKAREIRLRCPAAMRARLALETRVAHASVRRADRVICVSETMRSSVIEDLGDLPKLSVVPAAAPELPARVTRPRIAGPYVLSVGTDMPHKDWSGVIEAFARQKDLPPLVLVGWCDPARLRKLATPSIHSDNQSHPSVHILGPLTDRAELAALYRNASCVIAHSHLESYGLTAVEALAAGVPLAASDIPAHREFCGDAAHYYDPRDGEALTTAVSRAIDVGPSEVLAPAMQLSWAQNACMTAQILREAAADGSNH